VILDAGGRVGAYVVGSTLGISDCGLTPVTVASRWDAITDRAGYVELPDGDNLIGLGKATKSLGR
jgi:hypothetical protein